jgi:large subunit ribosomal protein L25
MKTFELKGKTRTGLGKKETKAIRANGDVPCLIYGGGSEIHFSVPTADLKHLVYTPNIYTVLIDVDGKSFKAVMKDIQFHPVTDAILHIDFQELVDSKEVIIKVPVRVTGNSVGVRAGGKLVVKMRTLNVKALPSKLPDHVLVNIEKLEIGKTFRVSELDIQGVQILDAMSNVILGVKATRQSQAAAEPTGKK